MTTITRTLLKQALESMCWAARTLNIDPDEAPNYHRSLEDIRAALAAPATAPDQCWCDEQGIGEPGVSCGDCPTRDYKATAPSWHDAPTEPGTWVLSLDSGMEVQENITQHEIDIEATWPGGRWYGPIPEDKQ